MTRNIGYLDPAQDPEAARKYEHLLQQVNVQDLLFCHNVVTKRFAHGRHRGLPVRSLVQACRDARGPPSDITPLVAVQRKQKLWVVFGNRRLKALKEFARSASFEVKCPVIVHPYEKSPPDLVVKFLDARTTRNGGTSASWA